jgi:hypothetical protein
VASPKLTKLIKINSKISLGENIERVEKDIVII